MQSHEARMLEWQAAMLATPGLDTPAILDGFCRMLRRSGFPVFRASLGLTTLHPQMQALRYVWYDDVRDPGPFPSPTLFRRRILHLDGNTVDEGMMTHGARQTPQFRASPFYALHQGAPRLSFRLAAGASHSYPVLDDFAAAGATHYLAFPVPVHEGQISLVTRKEGGFDDAAIASIEASLSSLAALLNASIKDMILDAVLDSYVGASPAREIKQGNIRPGAMLELEGAIWFSDIRDYSAQSRAGDPARFIARLNAYYELVVDKILAEDGEVLKFIGDAIMAVFVEREGTPSGCARALAAARAANQALGAGEATFEHGIGLHVGRFRFGNIGSLRRMDFTVIGSDVNLAARIAAQCAPLQSKLLMSEAFAAACGAPVRALGCATLKGFPGEHMLYGCID
jgi:adenylate cyclase